MNNSTSLLVAYRRRGWLARTGLLLAAAGLAATLTAGQAQEKGSGKKAPAQKKPAATKPQKSRQGGTPTLKVVPMPPGAQKGQPMLPPMNPGGPPIQIAPGGGLPMPGNPPGGMTFSFEWKGADIDNVLKFFAQVSNLTISKDPSLTGPVTIISNKQLTLDEAFKVLQSVLSVRGFNALKDGNVLTIVPLDRAVGATTLLNPEADPEGVDPRNQVMTQVIPLENVDAEALAKELTPLVNKGANLIGSPGTNTLILTDTSSNVQRFLQLVEALDKAFNTAEFRVYPLKRAEATDIVETVNNLFKQVTTRGRPAAPQPGQPPPQPQPGQPAPMGAGRAAVVAVADQRTNSVIVIASPDNQKKIADLISRLDDDDSNTLETKIRKIKYADAEDVANLVNGVLNNLRLGGAGGAAGQPGGAPFSSRVFGGFGDSGGRQRSQTQASNDPFAKVVADPRTNTVIITASSEKMAQIGQLIDTIDVDVPVETTTFVFPLKNAQADDVAYALGQAFSTNQNNNNFPFFFFGGGGGDGGGRRRQRINRRLNQDNNNNRSAPRRTPPGPPNAPDPGAGGSDDVSPGGSAIPQGIPGVMTPNGFVPTEAEEEKAKTRQFFFDDFGRRRGLGQNPGPQFGRGRGGSYVNLLQLQNNVFVTPSPGGDSLIITTTPDNYKALKEIIDALDVVPRQVLIEVIVAEVTLDTDKRLGLSLGGKFFNLFGGTNNGQARVNLPRAGAGSTFDSQTGGLQGIISSANYDALIQAISNDNKVKVISTPRVFTSNNMEAEIDITTQIPYITGQDAGFFNNTVSNRVEFLEVGFILNVIPRISRQGLVTIEVQQQASDLLRFDTLGTGVSAIRAPVVNDRYTDTAVTVQDGETIVIGGLIRDSKALNIVKVPILSEIPLIGQFFRSRQTVRNKTELMIFLTPRVVTNVQEARDLTLKQGQAVIQQLPDLSRQEPNLDLKRLPMPDATEQRKKDANTPAPETPGTR